MTFSFIRSSTSKCMDCPNTVAVRTPGKSSARHGFFEDAVVGVSAVLAYQAAYTQGAGVTPA